MHLYSEKYSACSTITIIIQLELSIGYCNTLYRLPLGCYYLQLPPLFWLQQQPVGFPSLIWIPLLAPTPGASAAWASIACSAGGACGLVHLWSAVQQESQWLKSWGWGGDAQGAMEKGDTSPHGQAVQQGEGACSVQSLGPVACTGVAPVAYSPHRCGLWGMQPAAT